MAMLLESIVRRTMSQGGTSRRGGMVLVSVLIIVVVLTLAAYQFSELMMAEYRAAHSYKRSGQAKALADSGVHYTAAMLSDVNAMANTLNYNPWDNPSVFQDVLVVDNDQSGSRGRFNVYTLRDPNDPQFTGQPYRYGVTDESSKLNLNALMQITSNDAIRQSMLMQLPNMNGNTELAQAILDWLDSTAQTPRTQDYSDYTGQDPPYYCKSGPMDSLDELLLVEGVTPTLLYGNDRNMNGVLDPDEAQLEDATGTVDLGWRPYLTIYSREPNVDSSGSPRIYLNNTDMTTLSTQLTTVLNNTQAVQFILAYRMYGPSGTMSTAPGARATPQNRLTGSIGTSVASQMTSDSSKPPKAQITSLFSLASATVSVPVKNGNQTTNQSLPNPFADPSQQGTLLPTLFDMCTTSLQGDLTPRINVNTAGETVLNMLQLLNASGTATGLAATDIQTILSTRPPLTGDNGQNQAFMTPAWLLTQANISPTTLAAIENYITTRSSVYSFQVVGFFDGPGPVARVEAVIDTNVGRPRILFYRDLAPIGKGFDPKADDGQ